MAVVSRLQLNHPALGTAGGAALHASIEALYEKIGDNISDRFFVLTDFDNAETEDLNHNYDTDISNIRYDLYNFTGGEWVRLDESTTPKRSQFTVIEKPSFESVTLQITNSSGVNDLTLAVVLTNDPLYLSEGDIKDIDVTTTPPEDGQALVYETSSGKFKPGASGDASFKIQSVTDPNAVIKGGPGIQLDSNQILRTYDGSGAASTDYGSDLTINLDTLLGGNPADNTTYWLYIDIFSLANSPTTLSDTGQKIYGVTSSNLVITTQDPENDIRHPDRYIPLGFIHSADSGTVWSGTGSFFGTQPFRHHERLAKFTSLPETFVDETIIAAAATNTLNHNLSGEPHGIMLTYDDGSTEVGLDPSSHLLDVTATQIKVASLGLTFGGGQKLRVRAWRFPSQPSLASSGRQFVSGWFQNTATTTLPHGLSDVENIRAYTVEEWDVSANRYRFIDPSALVVNFDGTNFYLNWSGLSPSATLQYRVIAGGSPLAFAIPLSYGGYNKFVGIGPGSYATLSAAIAAAAPGDSIYVARDTTEPAGDLDINVAGIKIEQAPNTKIGMSGVMTNGLRITAARVKFERLRLELNPSGAQSRGLSIEAADSWVEGKIEKIGAQTVTDGVHITSGGARTYAAIAIEVGAGAVTNLLTNNDGASLAQVWGG